MRDGQPVEVSLGQAISGIVANGASCSFPVPSVPVRITESVQRWPLGYAPNPDVCNTQGPPVDLIFRFTSSDGEFDVPVKWLGVDAIVEYDPPVGAVTTVKPTAPPSFAQLPSNGGPLHGSGSNRTMVMWLGIVAMLTSIASLVWVRR